MEFIKTYKTPVTIFEYVTDKIGLSIVNSALQSSEITKLNTQERKKIFQKLQTILEKIKNPQEFKKINHNEFKNNITTGLWEGKRAICIRNFGINGKWDITNMKIGIYNRLNDPSGNTLPSDGTEDIYNFNGKNLVNFYTNESINAQGISNTYPIILYIDGIQYQVKSAPKSTHT